MSRALRPALSLAVILALLLAGGSRHRAAAEPSPQPSFLVLLSDDQRADTIRAWGNKHIRTPSLDRLVDEGFSFRTNYCFGSNSAAVCVPSRAMLNTGRTWLRTKNDMSDAVVLPELLRQNGYTTFVAGKWHNGKASLRRGFRNGRSILLGGMSDHTKVPVADLVDGRLGDKRTGEKFSSELFADAAVEFLSTTDRTEPFYCYVAFTAPHDPRQPPPDYRAAYYEQLPPLPANFLPQLPFDNGYVCNLRDENLAAWPRTEEVVRDQLAEYYGMITHLDVQVGRVLDALRRSPHADNTYVIYASDHGLAMGSHGLLGKQNVYEHSMRCPLIVTGPGIPVGGSTRAFTYLLDVFPTVCGLAGVNTPEGLDGIDLASLWRGERDALRTSVFLPFRKEMRAVRDERWKLILYPQIHHTELFDLANDPHEMRNLANEPEQAQQIARLRILLGDWQRRTGDTQPLAIDDPKPAEVDLTGRERRPDRHQPQWIVDKYFEAEDR